ncbi:hypothetical protein D5R81_14600 [Parashewanella spongiae]|uniref:Uncharacterized protein n=1 Tax=Parashewanella spongiae TaxID=342950 RepID=A0A3A6TCY0_9GAMM|nr:hypothetical protein [Parashewanella spongiae]MCL1079308.1 hypothetical protein [Parashewanella spongiae]RJY10515.1 hypothetical protein D5R81_14600 [Parashewanella spongiae]
MYHLKTIEDIMGQPASSIAQTLPLVSSETSSTESSSFTSSIKLILDKAHHQAKVVANSPINGFHRDIEIGASQSGGSKEENKSWSVQKTLRSSKRHWHETSISDGEMVSSEEEAEASAKEDYQPQRKIRKLCETTKAVNKAWFVKHRDGSIALEVRNNISLMRQQIEAIYENPKEVRVEHVSKLAIYVDFLRKNECWDELFSFAENIIKQILPLKIERDARKELNIQAAHAINSIIGELFKLKGKPWFKTSTLNSSFEQLICCLKQREGLLHLLLKEEKCKLFIMVSDLSRERKSTELLCHLMSTIDYEELEVTPREIEMNTGNIESLSVCARCIWLKCKWDKFDYPEAKLMVLKNLVCFDAKVIKSFQTSYAYDRYLVLMTETLRSTEHVLRGEQLYKMAEGIVNDLLELSQEMSGKNRTNRQDFYEDLFIKNMENMLELSIRLEKFATAFQIVIEINTQYHSTRHSHRFIMLLCQLQRIFNTSLLEMQSIEIRRSWLSEFSTKHLPIKRELIKTLVSEGKMSQATDMMVEKSALEYQLVTFDMQRLLGEKRYIRAIEKLTERSLKSGEEQKLIVFQVALCRYERYILEDYSEFAEEERGEQMRQDKQALKSYCSSVMARKAADNGILLMLLIQKFVLAPSSEQLK